MAVIKTSEQAICGTGSVGTAPGNLVGQEIIRT